VSATSSAAVDTVERAMVRIRRRAGRQALAERARRGGAPLSPGVVQVLDVLESAEDAAGDPTGARGPAMTPGVTEVSLALRVDRPRASRLVAAAVEAGLVRRVADQADGRRAGLVRTAAGRAATERVRQFRRAAFEAAMADWTAAERATFARLLTRFVDALDGQDAGAGPRGGTATRSRSRTATTSPNTASASRRKGSVSSP
jgi:DNA-binding MarR family transcriptional regulator